MTEIYEINRKNYLELCKNVWDLDDDSLEYIKKRTSDEWEPVPELKSLTEIEGAKYEDQRIIFDLDMSNKYIQSLFEDSDESYKLFRSYFRHAISYLENTYNCNIGYKEFIENKVVFKKNMTKIKKVLEVVYAEDVDVYYQDTNNTYTKENCSDFIVKSFERIGTCKKSAKKLQFVISFNPMDWLLSSTKETWSSCFNIANDGGGYQYCLGLPFLCGDKNRMLLYITDGSTKECLDIKAHHYQTRTWCILDKSNSLNIVKWYPNDTIGVNPVCAITGDTRFKNRESFSKGKYDIDVISTKKGAVIGVYSDMGRLEEENNKLWLVGNSKEGQQLFTKNLIDLQKANTKNSFHFNEANLGCFGIRQNGYNIPHWKKFGIHVDMLFNSLRCECGSDKGGFLFKRDKYLCQDCYKEKVFTCGRCGEQDYKNGEIHEVTTTEGKKLILCQSCWENVKEQTCSCCGKYSTSSLMRTETGERICKVCFENPKNGWEKCQECGRISKNIKFVYDKFYLTSNRVCGECIKTNTSEISTFGRHFPTLTNSCKGRINNE